MGTQVYSGTLSVISCASCAIMFGVPWRFMDDRQQDHKNFYCPSGHSNHYPQESREEKFRRERDAARAKLISTEDQLQASRNEAERTRRNLVRERSRFANGVCPVCNRSFSKVKSHMDTKHPDFDTSHLLDGGSLFRCTCGETFKSYQGLRNHQARPRNTWVKTHETKV